ncbi:MAG: hypothetical protein ACRDGJ_07340 [Candidatus Limnocylindria bacterium]
MSWFPILLVVHISLAVALLLPSLALPFVLRRAAGPPGGVARFLMTMQGSGTLFIGLGLALTGGAMLALLGPELLTQPWLLVALTLYAANLLVAAFISRPGLRRLVGIGAEGDEAGWRRLARRQRWVAYAMGGLVGLIGFLMSVKPRLW